MDIQSQNIKVLLRIRPLNQKEITAGAQSCLIVNSDSLLTLDTKPEQKQFNYDYVCDQSISQQEIFQIVGQPLTSVCIQGLNCCIFAYGQTGAGKTYTMLGEMASSHQGLQPRVFDHLFNVLKYGKMQEEDQSFQWSVKCSYLEIYNEQIIDLLSNTKTSNLNIREDIKKGVYVDNLTEETTTSFEQALGLLTRGSQNRHVGQTLMNSESSRSHSIFSMVVEQKSLRNGLVQTKKSKLNFVDLAGSERQKQTAAQGDRLKEAGLINKSLTVLGLVINSLVESSQNPNNRRHIPYRDSKLTFILRESLGGNSRTFMIANVSSATTNFQEILSTLKFAQRAKLIKNDAVINEEMGGTIEGLKSEILRLKIDLAQANVEQTSIQIEDHLNRLIDDAIQRIQQLNSGNIELEGDLIVDKFQQCRNKIIQNISSLRFNKLEDIRKIEDQHIIQKKQNSQLIADITKYLILSYIISLKNQKDELQRKLIKHERLRKLEKKRVQNELIQSQIIQSSIETENIKQAIQDEIGQLQNSNLFYSKQNDNLIKQIDNVNSQLEETSSQFKQQDEQIEILMQTNTAKCEEIARLEEDYKDQIRILEDSLLEQKDQNDTMQLSIEFQRSEIENQQNALNQIRNQHKDQLSNIMENQINTQKEINQQHNTDLKKKDLLYQDLKKQYNQSNSDLNLYKNQSQLKIVQQEQIIYNNQNELSQLKSQNFSLTSQIKEFNSLNQQLNQMICNLQEQLSRLNQENQDKNELIQSQEQNIAQLNLNSKQHMKTIEQINFNLNDKHNQYRELQNQYEIQQNIEKQLRERVDEIQRQAQIKFNEMNKVLVETNKEIEIITIQVRKQEKENQKLRDDSLSQKKVEQSLRDLMEEQSKQNQIILNDLQKQQKKMELSEKQLKMAEESNFNLKLKIEEQKVIEMTLRTKVDEIHVQSQKMKEYCIKVQGDLYRAKACSDAIEKYEKLMDEFTVQKQKTTQMFSAYNTIMNKLRIKEIECNKFREEVALEVLQKEKYLKECEDSRVKIADISRKMRDLVEVQKQFNLEKDQVIDGRDNLLQTDQKYKLLVDNLQAQKQQNQNLTNELSQLQRHQKRLQNEKDVIQRKLEERYQLPSDITKSRKEIQEVGALKEKIEELEKHNNQLNYSMQMLERECDRFSAPRPLQNKQSTSISVCNSFADKMKSMIEEFNIKEKQQELRWIDYKCEMQKFQLDCAEVQLIREENKQLKEQQQEWYRNMEPSNRTRSEGEDYRVFDSVQKKIKY